jgi:HD superfamily phosphodiesterase
MILSASIKSAEQQFRQKLEEYFSSKYEENNLPSHGISHHRRVWEYARELMLTQGEDYKINNTRFPFILIIACYLHDSGMSVDFGPRHGLLSMEICRKFLLQNNLDEKDFPDLLPAILNHDNKDYAGSEPVSGIQTILSVADDLDAFGFTGIYRYLEIYIKRAIDPVLLGEAIPANASKRFFHFEKKFGFAEKLIEKHGKRYRILMDFFSGYNDQIRSGSHEAGYLGVADLIAEMIKKKITPEELLRSHLSGKDTVIRYFLEGFKAEMDNATLF